MDNALLDVVVCPVTRSRLKRDGEWLVSEVGGLRYPIKDEIPVLLPQEAKLPEGVASLEEFRKRFVVKG